MHDNAIFTTAHIEAFEATETLLREIVAGMQSGDGPVVDGSAYSPSDRAISYVESVWQDSSETEWEHFDWALQDLYESLDLVWSDGMLWRSIDLPSEDD